MKTIGKAGIVKIRVGTEQEAKDFCSVLEMMHGKLRYSRLDNVLNVHIGKRKGYMIIIKNWMNGLLTSSDTGNTASSKNRFLGTQTNYDGEPS